MKRLLNKHLILFTVGGTVYFLIEYFYKTFITGKPIHWSMFLLGGLCFIIIGSLNECFTWDMTLIHQGTIGAATITGLEFVFGCILNIWLDLSIWDYSHLPLNIFGQICLPFSIIWFFLAIVAILLDDFLRYKWFDEQKPHYRICRK